MGAAKSVNRHFRLTLTLASDLSVLTFSTGEVLKRHEDHFLFMDKTYNDHQNFRILSVILSFLSITPRLICCRLWTIAKMHFDQLNYH